MDEFIEEIKILNDENDFYNMFDKSKNICDFLENDTNINLLSKNNLIAIYGKWGTGKTCLMKTIEHNINKEKFETVWFDAWKYEKDDNLPYSLLKYIGKNKFGTKWNKMSNYAYGVFKSTIKGISINVLGVNVQPEQMMQEAEKQGERIKEQKSLWEKTEEFEKEYNKIKMQNNKRLIVFLDDLDRCESGNIISLISSMKLFLSGNPNIIFICGIDKNAVMLALKNKYNNDLNKAEEYLEKIFYISFNNRNILGKENFIKNIQNSFGFEANINDFVFRFFQAVEFQNPRHMKKVLRKFYLMKDYILDNTVDIEKDMKILISIYLIILNLFYDDEYKSFFTKEEKYKDVVLISGTTRYKYNNYKIEYIEFINSKTMVKHHEFFRFVEQFSPRKLINKELNAEVSMGGKAIIKYYEWMNLFEDNICVKFVNFIVKDLNSLWKLYNEKGYKEDEVMKLIKIIDALM